MTLLLLLCAAASLAVPTEAANPCKYFEVCVTHEQCRDGQINTDGRNIISPKLDDPTKCTTSDQTEGICCIDEVDYCNYLDNEISSNSFDLKRTSACPDGLVCTECGYCNKDGIVTDDVSQLHRQFTSGQPCEINARKFGVCCDENPPKKPNIVLCPLGYHCSHEAFCLTSLKKISADNTKNVECHQQEFNNAPGACCAEVEQTGDNVLACGKSEFATQQADTNFHGSLGENEADFGELPWQAIVFLNNGSYTFQAGASIIGEQHILTAAHKVDKFAPRDLRVRLGEWNIFSPEEKEKFVDQDVTEIHIHEDFESANLFNNVAILKLTKPITYKYNINRVCLPDATTNFPPGTRCLASGWGKESFEATNLTTVLKKLELPLVEHQDCQTKLRKTKLGSFFRLDKSFICAGGEAGPDSCTGDGGGPLVCQDPVTNGWIQVGITAWGIGCGQLDVPGAYSNVAQFVPWINSIISAP